MASKRPQMRQPLAPKSGIVVKHEKDGPWLVAGRGLKTYSVGVVLRLILGMIFFIGMLLAVTSSAGATTIGLLAFSVMSIITGFVMLAGLSHFARQPADSPGRSSARFAATVLAVGLALELFCFLLGGMAAVSSSDDSQIAMKFAQYVDTLWRWAVALWLAHVGATIVAMWKLAPVVEDKAPDNRRYILPGMVLAAGIALFVTWNAMLELKFGVTGTILAISMTALAMLAALALYVAAVDQLGRTLRACGNVLPKSRLRR